MAILLFNFTIPTLVFVCLCSLLGMWLGAASGVLYAMGINPSLSEYLLTLTADLGYVGVLVATLMLVRNRGYRLVRVQPVANHKRAGSECGESPG